MTSRLHSLWRRRIPNLVKIDDPRIEAIRLKYDLAPSDFWELPQAKGRWCVKHSALETVAAKADILFEPPILLEADSANGIAAICVTGKTNDRLEWATGEASPKNNKNSYPWAMAEKRAKDRVILKLAGLQGLLNSDAEMDAPSEAMGASVAASEPLANQTAKLYFKVIQDDLMASTTLKQLGFAWSRHEEIVNLMAPGTQDELAAFKADLQHRMEEAEGGNLQADSVAILEGKLREALIMDDLKKVWDLSSQALRKLKPEQVSYLNRVKEDMKGVIEGRELARAEQAARLAATP